MGLEDKLNNFKNKVKELLLHNKREIVLFTTILTNLNLPLLLSGGVSGGGTFHAKQDSTIRGYAPVEIISNYDYETDTTDSWGRYYYSLLNTNIGDTINVNARKDTLGKTYIANIKDIADGIGDIPEVWMYDSTGTKLRTLSIYKIVDSLNQNNWDSLKPLTKLILPNKPTQPDSMVVDTAGQKIYNPSNYDDWRWESHWFHVYMPLWNSDSLPINIQPGDTGIFALYKLNSTADSVKAFIDTMIYTGKYGDAWVREIPGLPYNQDGEQYDTLILKEDYILEPYFVLDGGTISPRTDTIPLWKGTIAEWNNLWSQTTLLKPDTIKPDTTSNKPEYKKPKLIKTYLLKGKQIPKNQIYYDKTGRKHQGGYAKPGLYFMRE